MRRIQLAMLEPYLRERRLPLAPGRGSVNDRKISRALEAGCGTGYFSARLQRERKLPLIAMDFSAEGLRYGAAFGLERAMQGSLLDLPFASGAFDFAMALDVLQQLAPGEERLAISELARIVRPGGLLALRVSAFEALRSRHSEYVQEQQRFTRRELCRLLEHAGFRVLRATYANTLLSPIALIKFRLIERLQSGRAKSGIQPLPPWVNSALYSTLAAEAAWIRAGFNLPFGQSLLAILERLGA